MPREEFLLTDYLRSFPDLVGSIDVFTGGDKEHRALLAVLEDGGDWTAHLTPAEVVLPSSVCHPLYGMLPNDVPAEGLDEECSGWSFRHEPSLDPARMQIFRIYEFVHDRHARSRPSTTATSGWSAGLAALHRARAAGALRGRQRPVLRPGRQDAGGQPARPPQLKYEMCLDLTEVKPTAIGSSNYHEDHFGHALRPAPRRRDAGAQRLHRLRPGPDHAGPVRHPRHGPRGLARGGAVRAGALTA